MIIARRILEIPIRLINPGKRNGERRERLASRETEKERRDKKVAGYKKFNCFV